MKIIGLASSLTGADSQVWRHRASLELAAGDLTAAMKSIDQAIAINPGDELARRDRADLRIRMHDYDGALADLNVYEKAAAALTEFPAGYNLAQLYARAGKPDDSLRVLDKLIDRDKRRPEVIALRAELAGDAGSSAEARAALEDLLKANPKDANLLARLGSCLPPNRSGQIAGLLLSSESDRSEESEIRGRLRRRVDSIAQVQ
jgi:tetratricopeptide (TPR) repeat protein